MYESAEQVIDLLFNQCPSPPHLLLIGGAFAQYWRSEFWHWWSFDWHLQDSFHLLVKFVSQTNHWLLPDQHEDLFEYLTLSCQRSQFSTCDWVFKSLSFWDLITSQCCSLIFSFLNPLTISYSPHRNFLNYNLSPLSSSIVLEWYLQRVSFEHLW